MQPVSMHLKDHERGAWDHPRFELRGCLGEGAFGVVYRAHDRERDRAVALKVLRNLGSDRVFYFKQELRQLASLAHPNLVHYRELFEDRGRWFLCMDLVEGVTLREHVRGGSEDGSLDEAQLSRLREGMRGLASALRTLHGAGKVHGDVKPSNVRVDVDGRVVLLDFGLMTEAGEWLHGPLGVSEAAAAFLAPEQVERRAPGPEADWYAVGAMLYDCLVGRPPFEGDPEQVLVDKCAGPAPLPESLVAGVPPELSSLCAELLERWPEARRGAIHRFERALGVPPSTMPPQALRVPGHARFVGREAELEALAARVMDHATPGLRFGLVFGEPGLGKSALLEELWTRVGERHPEVRVLSGRCFEREAAAYNALDGVARGLAELLGELPDSQVKRLLPEGAGVLAHSFAALARVPALAEAVAAPAQAAGSVRRADAFRALRDVLRRIAQDGPLVVAIDDVQWADADSLRLLHAVFGGDDPPPCLLLCVGRTRPQASDAVARTLRRLEHAARDALHLHLRPLADDEAHALALDALPAALRGQALAQQIVRESGGFPVFIEVLAQHCHSRESEAGEPLSLATALQQALDGFDGDALRLAQGLALAGLPLSESVACRAARLSPRAFTQALAALTGAGWVRAQRAQEGGRWALAHERMRASIVATLGDAARAELHWELAQALLEAGGDAEPIALHFAEAGDSERALRHAQQGAEASARACAFSHAERLYLLALAHLPNDAGEERRAIVMELARVHQLAGRSREAGDLYAELAADAQGETALAWRYRAGEAWLDSGYYEEGLPWMRALLDDMGVRIQAGGVAAQVSALRARASALVRRGTPLWRDVQSLEPVDRLRVDALYKLTCAMLTAEPGRSRGVQARHLAEALRSGDAYRAARAYALEVWQRPTSPRSRGQLGLDSNLALARRLSRTSDSPHARALVQLAEGVMRLSDDLYSDAAARFGAAAAQLAEHVPDARWERTYAQYYGALCAWHMGEFSRVCEAVEVALQDATAHGDVLAEVLWCSRLGHVPALLSGRADTAAAALKASLRPARRLPHAELHARLSRVEVELYRNDPWAFDQLEAVWQDIEQGGSLRVRSTRRRALWVRGRAALCSARLNVHRREELLRVAQGVAARLGADATPAATARAAMVESGVLELRGRRREAEQAYARASAAAEEAGCWALVATADGRRAELMGGERGETLRERAHGFLRRAGASDPARVAAVLNGF